MSDTKNARIDKRNTPLTFNKMTKKQKVLVEKIKSELLQEVDNPDREVAQSKANDALCELLEGLGFIEIVGIYKKIGLY